MVNIYLNVDGSQESFLSIPDSDVGRLSIRPFRWLRYVMFSICGAHGDISATPDGPPVDYNSTSLADITDLYCNPSGMFLFVCETVAHHGPHIPGTCIFVDHEGLHDGITSTNPTERRTNFREEIIRRDGSACVVTRLAEEHCDAVHSIPRGKSDEVCNVHHESM
jgi:hypothetical protein